MLCKAMQEDYFKIPVQRMSASRHFILEFYYTRPKKSVHFFRKLADVSFANLARLVLSTQFIDTV